MLIYDEPINQAKPDPRPAAMSASGGFSVLDLIQLLWRRKIAIASAALLCACVAVAIGKSLTPKYTASAQLYVDPRELQLVDRELTPRAPDLNGLAMVVESQARVITSNNVLLQVIRETHLEKDPEFGGGDGKSLFGTLLGLFGIELKPTAEQQKLVQMAALETLLRHINVKKTDKTFIVDIDVWSTDPAKAAMLSNAIAKAYLAESSQSQAARVRRATSDLSGRLKELQERLRNAENTLAVYKAQNNFVGTQDTLISDQQLSASNQRLAAARALTLDAQAKYDQIAASRKMATDAGAIPEALQSPTIANLRSQYAEAKKRQAELHGELGPRHPALRQMEQQVEDLRRSIGEETNRFLQAAKNDLTRAQDYEASLNKALDVAKAPERPDEPGRGPAARTRTRRGSQPRRLSVVPEALARDRRAGDPEHVERAHHRRRHGAAAAHLPAGHEPVRDDRLCTGRARRGRLDHRRRPAGARRKPGSAQPDVGCA